MALPKQTAPKYTCILPSDGREIEYRPFLVKEQKVLLLAQEQEDDAAMFRAVQDLITNVCEDVKSETLPVIDMEWLFLKIRSKSVGETANIKLTCTDPKCDGTGEAVVNLDDVEVVGDQPESKIMLNDEIGIELRYPRVSDVNQVQGKDQATQTLEMLKNSIVKIFDEENVYPTADASTNELNEFVEGLTMQQLEKITTYFDSIPSLQLDVESKCTTCDRELKTTAKGINSFF
jgi:hypothetical protein|tara:strand:+ start:1826 stop:2524 length:699 start_codon:yes stop_codon:yes gene_type:complete